MRSSLFNSSNLYRKAHSRFLLFLSFCWIFSSGLHFKVHASCLDDVQNKLGALFLHQRQPNRHSSPEINRLVASLKAAGAANPHDPVTKMRAWIEVLKKTHLSHENRPNVLKRLKNYYFKKYVITADEIPESYFAHQQQLAREQGHGEVQMDHATRFRLSKILISDQQASLEAWLDYFLSRDTRHYPMWAKIWVFEGVVKLGKLDKFGESWMFSNRSRGQVAPFPELNREALAQIMELMQKHVYEPNNPQPLPPKMLELAQRGNFGQMYAYVLQTLETQAFSLHETKGEWRKYLRGSDPTPLVRSLCEKNTGWCTAGQTTAEAQLKDSDFYVYYSNDGKGNPAHPRIAIRMEGDQITEVRGIAEAQNLDPHIAQTNILNQKLQEFGSRGEQYKKRSADMKRLTLIEKKTKDGHELSAEELRFLYSIDGPIDGFGYGKDPRIQLIISTRASTKADLSKALNIPENKISLTKDEALSGDILYHYGDLDLSEFSRLTNGLRLPKKISGHLFLNRLTSIDGLTLPNYISGSLNLSALRFAKNLIFPDHVGGYLSLTSLESAQGIKLPNRVDGSIDLNGLTSADGLILPNQVNWLLELKGLKSARNLKLPDYINGMLDLSGLISTEGLVLPSHISGSLNLNGLTSTNGLNLPEHVEGDLVLRGLTTSEGLKLPDSVTGDIYLSNLKPTQKLKRPRTLTGKIYFKED